MQPSPCQPLRLWQAISRIPSLKAPKFLWQAELAEHWSTCQTFLTATSELAKWTLASDGVTVCEVIQHSDSALVGINRVAGESFEVTRDAQIVCKLNTQKLARQIVQSLDGRIDYSLTAPESKVHRLGRLPPKLASAPLHLSVHSDGDSLLASATSLASPSHKVLLVPTLHCVNIDVDLLAEQFKTIIVALDKLIVEGEEGWVCQAHMLDELGNLLGLGPTVDSNSFRIQGENYQICYGGKQFSLSGSVGLWYLRELLTHPHQEFDPVELESARTGVRARSSTSPTGEIFDAEARRQNALRLSEVDEEIAEAAEFNDLGRLSGHCYC